MGRGNGGIIGPYNTTTSSASSGVWSLKEQRERKTAGEWQALKQCGIQAFVLGGGGGGAGGYTNYWGGGGGGAGAFWDVAAYTEEGVRLITVTIGAAGAGGPLGNNSNADNGSDTTVAVLSHFSVIPFFISNGGGGGGGGGGAVGSRTGGSTASSAAAAAPDTEDGLFSNVGGRGISAEQWLNGGGGGGAGGAGSNGLPAPTGTGGAGGAGKVAATFGGTYGGGGGGGCYGRHAAPASSGGSGGGGAGAANAQDGGNASGKGSGGGGGSPWGAPGSAGGNGSAGYCVIKITNIDPDTITATGSPGDGGSGIYNFASSGTLVF